jgi:uncharacterized protein YbjQ (UPF0145 family)
MSELFLWINEQAQGPFDIDQVTKMLADGVINHHTLWSQEGDQQWQAISELPMPRAGGGSLLGIIATTGNTVEGSTIGAYLGVVRGIVVRSPNLVQGMFGGLKQMVGGNIESYAQVCEEARRQAFERMVQQADRLNADAIIGVRYDATEFTPGATEVLAYGTAVRLARVEE